MGCIPPSMMGHIPVIPISSCSRMWQWTMVIPVHSITGTSTVEPSPGVTITVSFDDCLPAAARRKSKASTSRTHIDSSGEFDMRHALLVLLVCLFISAVLSPAPVAGQQHLEPGTIVADGGPDQGVVVLLYVQSGHKDAQAVYVVRPVSRCRDPGGPGWYANRAIHELRSAPELENGERLGTLDPTAIPAGCASPVPGVLPPARQSAWDRFVDGTLDPFGPVTFPAFGPSGAVPLAADGPAPSVEITGIRAPAPWRE